MNLNAVITDGLVVNMATENPLPIKTDCHSEEDLSVYLREERDEDLLQVDVHSGNVLRWAELSTDQQTAWSQYRIDLLNVPQQDGFPNTITWPTKPE